MKRSKIFLGISALALGYTANVSAQTPPPQRQEIEEIVVTAEHRKVNIQKTALAVSVINGDEISDHGKTTVSQVLSSVPSVQIQGVEGGSSALSVAGGGGPPNVAIRGLGTDGPNKASSTAFYVDGVLWQGGGGEFYDVNRVEVLRGPQGTLYGRGATGGAINVITRDPTQKFEADARVQIGTKSLLGLQGIVNAPISDTLSMRLGVNQTKRDGYMNNGMSDQDDVNARFKLLIKPSNDFSLLLGATYYQSNNNGAGTEVITAAAPNPVDWNSTTPAGGANSKIDYHKIYAKLEWNLGPAVMTYTPAVESSNSYFLQIQAANTARQQSNTMPYNRTQSHELRFANATDGDFIWDAGLYLYENEMEQMLRVATNPMASATNLINTSLQRPTQSSRALYGEMTYKLTPSLRGTVGGRVSRDTIGTHTERWAFTTNTTSSADYKKDFSHNDWKLRLESDLSPTSLVYGMISTAYRPGGNANGQFYGNEVVTAYEVGSKNRFGSYTVNASGYYYDYSGFQSLQSSPNSLGQPVSVVVSIPAKIYGLEVEFAARLTPNDKVTLTPSFMKGTYSSDGNYVNASNVASTVSSKDKELARIPKVSLTAGYTHSVDLASGAAISADLQVRYQSEIITDFDTSNYPSKNPLFVQAPVTFVDASVSYVAPSGNYTVTLYGKNLGNKITKLNVNTGPKVTTFVNDPRSFGVVLNMHF